MAITLIRGGRIIDPAQGIDRVGHLVLDGNKILGVDAVCATPDLVIDATDRIVAPGLVDMHVSLREPGNEEDESIGTGTAAALAGGITSVACMPDTNPVVDNRAEAEFVVIQGERAGNIQVYPLGAVTKNVNGEELAEIGQLVAGGVVAFTDGRKPVANAEIMRRALQYTSMFQRPVFNRPQVPELVHRGVMHDGFVSTRLGLRGIPAAAEEIMVGRDIALCRLTGGRLHLLTLSTSGGVVQVRRAKEEGLRVTAEVAIHQLLLTDESLMSFDANFKVDPPFRTQDHIDGLISGLKDGTIDAIVSDHQPHASEKKSRELDDVPFGIVGLETLLPLCITGLVEPGHLSWPKLLEKLTCAPARILGVEKGSLQSGRDADVTIIDPQVRWKVDATTFRSKGRNTPFHGRELIGRAVQVFVKGVLRHQVQS